MKINSITTQHSKAIINKISFGKSVTKNNASNTEIPLFLCPKNYYSHQLTDILFGSLKFKNQISTEERLRGCLYGGAIGDSFSSLIEWLSTDEIKQKYGVSGLRYIPKRQGLYRVTDDTQMTLFTCEGLMKSILQEPDLTKEPNYDLIYSSYQNWYDTQTANANYKKTKTMLMRENSLFVQRSPGNTCMSTLEYGVPGTIQCPINDSMGNGGIMRVAPVGLIYSKNPELAFRIGMKTAALTHGHPNAYLPAGYLSALIAQLTEGKSIEIAVEDTNKILAKYPNYESTLECIKKAIKLSKTDINPSEAIENIGYGCRGDEALGISLYAVLKSPNNLKKALTIAVNHSGDSDSTGSIAGNIIGTALGISKFQNNWVEKIEHADLMDIFALAIDSAKTLR